MTKPEGEHWPDSTLADSLECGPDPPWSDKVIYWLPSRDDPEWSRLPPGFPKPWCDTCRPDWHAIHQEWKERKRVYIWLCERHAVAYGFAW